MEIDYVIPGFGIPEKYITKKFRDLSEDIQKYYNKLDWDECYIGSQIPTYYTLEKYLNNGNIKDTKNNMRLLEKIF